MKKIILTLITVATIATQVKAQDSTSDATDPRTKLTAGLKVGGNYSNVYDSEGESFEADPNLGFAGGVFVAIPLGKFLGIQPEVLFSQKGFTATGNLLGSTYKVTRTTDYIDVPLFLALKPSEFLTLVAGPQYSYLIKQRDTFTSSIASYDQEKEFSNDNIRKNTLGIAVGLDLNLNHIVISARAAWDVQNNAGDGTSSTPRYKNALYQATVGYRFF